MTLTAAIIARRQAEAERIATAEGFAILDHDADWQRFTLDDPLYIDDTTSVIYGRTIHTHFVWESFRFEGFVS